MTIQRRLPDGSKSVVLARDGKSAAVLSAEGKITVLPAADRR